MFTLGDGGVITDEETGAEMAAFSGGPVTTTLDIAVAKVARILGPGSE